MLEESSFWKVGVPEYKPRPVAIPEKVDVAVIGAGYTGLGVALHLARGGRSVAVFDADEIGFGCSSRNGGMVGPSFHKLGTAGLTAKYGEAKAIAILREGMLALDYFEQFLAEEKIDCDFTLSGRFRGAATAADYEAMAREGERLQQAVGLPFDMVPRASQHEEVGSDFYSGGIIYHRDGGVHPRKLVNELAKRAEAAGAILLPYTRVTGIQSEASGQVVYHPQGQTSAREVVIATNGYSDRGVDTMRRRLVPIRTNGIVTEELTEQEIRALSPKLRMHGESTRVFMWYRPTPDGRRFMFGGRMAPPEAPLAIREERIRNAVVRVFPQLAGQKFSHLWWGDVAYTQDHAPHLAQIKGVWHVGGYCGSGVTRSLYFADKVARRILGKSDAQTAFDDLSFAPIPFHFAASTVARALTAYYAWQDRRDARKSER